MARSDRRRAERLRKKQDDIDPSHLTEEGWKSGAQFRQRLGHYVPSLNERIGAIRQSSHLPPIIPKNRVESLEEIAKRTEAPPPEVDRPLIPLGDRHITLAGLSVCIYAEGPEMIIRVPWGSLEEAEKAVGKIRRELEPTPAPNE